LNISFNIGKRNNQNFVQIPYLKLINYLEYKCKINNINFTKHEKSYTSKCDSLALEEIKKHKKYLGKRVKRGLFKSSIGQIINADINGALNILRKILDKSKYESLIKRIMFNGIVYRPLKIRI